MEKVLFNLDGIKSKQDQSNIKTAIKDIDGIGKISIDPENNQVEVTYDMNTASASQIYQCLESTGHHITNQSFGELDKRK